jgi:hypothetical protein
MSFPGISFSTWNADPGMRRIVNRNSSRMEAGESCKKVYRNYLNHSWPASLARTPSEIQPRETCALRVCQHDSTCEGRRKYVK